MSKFLDWENAGEEAQGAWQGYLWSARLNAGLTDTIRPYLLQTASRVSELGDFAYTYLQLLIMLFMLDLKGFTKKYKRIAIEALTNSQLESLSRALDSAQKGAGDRRTEYWTYRVRPFIVDIWPKRIERRTQIIARNFAKLCLDTGAAFGDAVNVLSSWFRREEADYYLMQVLHQGDLASKCPADALRFLDLTVPDQMDFGQDELRKCLEKIEAANPALQQLPSFNRLSEIALQ